MTDLLGSSGLLLIASAAVFGPLAGWLAGRRGRNPIVWFVFGALLGPLAVLLLAISPPGRCPLCDSVVPGWTAECQVCGGPLSPRLGATIHPTHVVRPRASDPGPLTPAVERKPVVRPSGTSPAVEYVGARTPAPAVRVGRGIADSQGQPPDRAEVLATGICFGGSSGLTVGARYVVTRRGDALRLLGPVDRDPSAVAIERPLAHLTATAIGDRLVIIEGAGDRIGMSLALGFLAGANPEQLERALAVGDGSGSLVRQR